jgi:hypothetical protein
MARGAQRGARHPRWKAGVRVNSDGYLQITAGPLRGEYVHKLVLKAKLGRDILPGYEAHHKNGDTLDARPENLEERAIDGDNGHRPFLNGRPWWAGRSRPADTSPAQTKTETKS